MWSKRIEACRSFWGVTRKVSSYVPAGATRTIDFTLEIVRQIQKLIKSVNQKGKSVEIGQTQLVEMALTTFLWYLKTLSEMDETSSFDPLENSEFEKEGDLTKDLNEKPQMKPLRIFNPNPKSERGVVKEITTLESFQSSDSSLDSLASPLKDKF